MIVLHCSRFAIRPNVTMDFKSGTTRGNSHLCELRSSSTIHHLMGDRKGRPYMAERY